jgi:RNA polymerase sigma-70 factor (ECF subfamily)
MMNVQMETIQTTDQLVCQAQAGDRDAFGELVLQHRSGVINVVYRMCGDPALAEDAAQMAFIRAWQHLGDYHPVTSFKSWLYRIAVNVALDELRRTRPVEDIDRLEVASGAQGMQASLEQRERQAVVQKAVQGLPPAARAVLVLREYAGLSYHEISEALEIPAGTVMSRLNYARKCLITSLKPQLEEV